jgi:hypothetical protein
MVSGASRGIGKAAALALAKQGFDLVITARTLEPGEQHHDIPLPGSLRETAVEIEALGRQVMLMKLDILQADKITQAWEVILAKWERIDVLVNNAIYQGAGLMDRVMDLKPVYLGRMFRGNVFSPVLLVQLAVEQMRKQGGGRIINMVSAAAMTRPVHPVDKGGWSFAYAASKAAFQQLAGILKVELAGEDIQVFNLDPGLVITELMTERGIDKDFARQFGATPMSVPAAVIAWLASDQEALQFNGETVSAQKLAIERKLHNPGERS